MWNRVFILSMPNDIHAFAVREAIERLGGEAYLYLTTNFPKLHAETLEVDHAGDFRIHLEGIEVPLKGGNGWTVWNRRPSYQIDEANLHPADRGFASLQCRRFRAGLMRFLLPDAFWVNPLVSSAAEIKARQQRAAVKSGLKVPETLYTNDPASIRAFLRRHGNSVIYKPLLGTAWRDKDLHQRVIFTTKLSEADLVKDELLRNVPGIYQNYVEKDYELRVTFVGKRALAAKVYSQQSEFGSVDWRQSYDDLQMEAVDLPRKVYQACREVMRDLGIVFGCFDLIVTPEGEYVFLEVNQMGQWLFIEMMTGLPMVDIVSHFLLSGAEDFDWRESRDTIRFSDLQDTVEGQLSQALETGVIPREWVVEERAHVPSKG